MIAMVSARSAEAANCPIFSSDLIDTLATEAGFLPSDPVTIDPQHSMTADEPDIPLTDLQISNSDNVYNELKIGILPDSVYLECRTADVEACSALPEADERVLADRRPRQRKFSSEEGGSNPPATLEEIMACREEVIGSDIYQAIKALQ